MNKIDCSKIVSTIIISLTLVSCGERSKQDKNLTMPAGISVSTYKVSVEDVIGIDKYPGTVVPLNEVALRPQVSGYITNIYVKDGQKVKKGQKLYEIDRSKYAAAYNQAKANLQSARANLERVKKDLERYKRLHEKEAIAKQKLDYAETDLLTATSQVTAAEAAMASAATDLDYSIIKAPFEGTLGISNVRIGAQVSLGQPLLNTISSDDPVAVDFVVNEKEISRFQKMRNNTQAASSFKIGLSNGTLYPYNGTLNTIDRAVNRQTGSITVRLDFPNPEHELIPGMTVNVSVPNQDIGDQIVIPYKAVTEQLGEYYIFSVQGDSVIQKRVSLGTRFNDIVVVRKGLEAGEQIVLTGIQRLRNGSKIDVEVPGSAENQTLVE